MPAPGMRGFGWHGVDGMLRSPAGQGFGIRTIWIVHFGEDFPRLVTAYPRTQR